MKKIIVLTIAIAAMIGTKEFANNPINSMGQSMNQTYALINLYAPKNPPLPELFIENQTIALIQAGTNINDLNRMTGYTALHMAASNPFISYNLLSLLLNNGALVYAQTMQDETPLTLAARNDRSPDIINLFLTMGIAQGADPMHIEKNGNTALNYLLYNLKRHQLDGNQAAYNQTYSSITFLINELNRNWHYSGTTSNVQKSFILPGYYGPNTPNTTLSWLAYLGDESLINLFISFFGKGIVSPNYINQKINGKTAYDWAQGNSQMLKLLRSYGGQKGVYSLPATAPTVGNREIWAPLYQTRQ